ncbi:mitochondrial small ribosomal subunit Rsm22-domain-containing protein [Pilobolus umbonatus]|nr:mitochondrial small ribosomal subunit Rsm22-domain-containing protein [Pilobolus umbonatus]
MAHRQLFRSPSVRHYTQKAIFLSEKELLSLASGSENLLVKEATLSSDPVLRGSEEASFGSKRIGAVELPKPLVNAITDLIERHDKRLLRSDALRLYEALRSTARQPKELEVATYKKKKTVKSIKQTLEPHNITYGPREAIAYTAGVLSSNYAAIYNVLNEVSRRIPDLKPSSMLDFGTGPGTAIWAANEVFDIKKHVGIDISEDMLRIAEDIEGIVKKSDSEPVEFKRYLTFNPKDPPTDLVISAFTLSDIASMALQKSTVEQLWKQTGDILVLVDRGTPIGFSNIAKARQWILDMEKDNAHVVAPCPNDKPCPLLFSPTADPNNVWCHFSQRVQRPNFLMKTKHSKFNAEDSMYSYVVLRKGSRPLMDDTMETQAYQWPRLIQPPLKRNGHVVMDVCSTNGTIERMVVPKSQGKVPYRDARKVMWGDLFPHGSKNKVLTRTAEGVIDEETKIVY